MLSKSAAAAAVAVRAASTRSVLVVRRSAQGACQRAHSSATCTPLRTQAAQNVGAVRWASKGKKADTKATTKAAAAAGAADASVADVLASNASPEGA